MATATRGDLYVAVESFAAKLDGEDISVSNGKTLVREGHPLLVAYPHLFKLAEADFEVEQATSSPGEKRAR